MNEYNQDFELDLNRIMTEELCINKGTIPLEISMPVIQTLIWKGVYHNSKEFLKEKHVETFEELSKKYPNQYEKSSIKENGKWKPVIYDYYETCIINTDDKNYNFFFTLKLRQLSIFDIDNFLNYQLEFYYKNDIHCLSQYLNDCLLEYEGKLIKHNTCEKVHAWIESNPMCQIGTIQNSDTKLQKEINSNDNVINDIHSKFSAGNKKYENGQGWQRFFYSKDEYKKILFLFAAFCKGDTYELPEQIIKSKDKIKAPIAAIIYDIYKEYVQSGHVYYNINLINNIRLFDLIRILKPFIFYKNRAIHRLLTKTTY